MRIQITLKSGAQVEADVEKFSTARSPLTQELTKLAWTTPADWTAKLCSIGLDEIAAIVALDSSERRMMTGPESGAVEAPGGAS